MMSWNSSSIRDRFKPILMPASKIADNLEMTALSNELSFDEIRDLGTHLKVFRIPEDDTLFAEGDTESYMGILIRGRLQVLKGDALGRQRRLCQIGPGKTVGEMSLIDGQPRSATIKTEEESVVMVLFEGHFKEILETKPRLGVKLLLYLTELMSARLRMTTSAVADILSREG